MRQLRASGYGAAWDSFVGLSVQNAGMQSAAVGRAGLRSSLVRALQVLREDVDLVEANVAVIDVLLWWRAIDDSFADSADYARAVEESRLAVVKAGLIKARNAGAHGVTLLSTLSQEPLRRWPRDWNRGIFQHQFVWVDELPDSSRAGKVQRDEQTRSYRDHLSGRVVELVLLQLERMLDAWTPGGDH